MKNNHILGSIIFKKEIMHKLFFILLSIMVIITFLLFPVVSFAYKTGVHMRITYEAVNKNKVFFNQVLKNIGFTNGVNQIIKGFGEKPIHGSPEYGEYGWLEYGSKWEDNIGLLRIYLLDSKGAMYNHFFNPLYNLGYYEIEDGQIKVKGESLITRMNDSVPDDLSWDKNHNEWAYQMARKLYYAALTGNSYDVYMFWYMRDNVWRLNPFKGKENMNQSERDQFFAWTFQALGHIMHLIQDASVPAHTRNDKHAFTLGYKIKGFFEPYEEWTNENLTDNDLMKYTGFGSEPWLYWKSYYNHGSDTHIPIQDIFIDYSPLPANPSSPDTIIPSETFEQGLAEYSFANFLSEDSIMSYDLPAQDGLVFEEVNEQNGKQHKFIYRESNNFPQSGVKHLMRLGTLQHIVDPNTISANSYCDTAFTVDDEEVIKDYVSKLIPRAVGYSAGFLEYFFRGSIEISSPEEFVYSIIDGSESPQEFTYIKAKLKNATPKDKDEQGNVLTYEDMGAGTLVAVAKYKKRENIQPDLLPDQPSESSREANFSYSVSAPVSISSLDSETPEELTFDFTENPIPVGITDLYLQVVFKGTLGNENNTAIAVGMKDLNEPDYYNVWNSTDIFCLDGVPRTSEEIKHNSNLFDRVDLNHDGHLGAGEPDIEPHDFNTGIAFLSTEDNTVEYYHGTYIPLQAGRYGRVIVLTGEPNFRVYVKYKSVNPPVEEAYLYTVSGTVNQENEGEWHATGVADYRGAKSHFYIAFTKYYPPEDDLDDAVYP